MNLLKGLFWLCAANLNFGFWWGVAGTHYLGWIGTLMAFLSLIAYFIIFKKYLIPVYNKLKDND